MLKAFKYRFYPTPQQNNLLRRTLGCVRLVYNKALALRSEAWVNESKSINFADSSKQLTQWKTEDDLSFLNEVPAVPLQQSLRNLDSAFRNFFKKHSKYPRFKKKSNRNSASYVGNAVRIRNKQCFIVGSKEPLNIRWSRSIPDSARVFKSTITLTPSGKWFISIQAELPDLPESPRLKTYLGVDLGLNDFIVTHKGFKSGHPKFFAQYKSKLARAQRQLSRKVKGSKNRNKARIKVARIYERITNCRTDFLHKLSTKLIQENQLISVEDLCIKGMIKNKRLSRSIADSGWGEFVRQLTYKADWYGRTLIKIDRFYPSSKTCSECDYKMNSMPLSVREWTCPNCGAEHDRDVNAALNILAAGLVASVCGATINPKSVRDRGRCDEAETLSCEA